MFHAAGPTQAAGSTLIRDTAPATEPGANPPDARGIYELRNYQLVPGYDTVPKLRQMFKDGLPSKIEADGHGRLVAFAARFETPKTCLGFMF